MPMLFAGMFRAALNSEARRYSKNYADQAGDSKFSVFLKSVLILCRNRSGRAKATRV